MKRGGVRLGAGRKRTIEGTLRFKDYWTREERLELIEEIKKEYKGNPKLMVAIIEHIWGKAPQAVSLDSNAEHPITIEFVHKNFPTLPIQ